MSSNKALRKAKHDAFQKKQDADQRVPCGYPEPARGSDEPMPARQSRRKVRPRIFTEKPRTPYLRSLRNRT